MWLIKLASEEQSFGQSEVNIIILLKLRDLLVLEGGEGIFKGAVFKEELAGIHVDILILRFKSLL